MVPALLSMVLVVPARNKYFESISTCSCKNKYKDVMPMERPLFINVDEKHRSLRLHDVIYDY